MGDAPVFIVGAARSGTGLLRDLLRSHPRLSFPPESHFIPSYYRAYGDPRSDRHARRLAAAILRRSRVRYWNLDMAPAELDSHRSFTGLSAHIYRAWADREGKPRWGDKTPRYVFEISLLAELFPDARFLHIYRDGRDVALSQLPVAWGPTNAVTAARLWRDRVIAGRRDGGRLSANRYRELSYERLVEATEETMREVCEFLEEEFVPEILIPTRLPSSVSPAGGRPRSDWIRPAFRDRVDPARAGSWRTEMDAADRARFEAVAGELLTELGYPVVAEARGLSLAERAEWRGRELVERVLKLRRRPPAEFRDPTWSRVTLATARLRRSLGA